MKYEAILFDFDGVLADTEPLHFQCWRHVLGSVGLDLSWDYYERECIGVSDREMLVRLGRLANPPRPLDQLWPLYPDKKRKFAEESRTIQLISPATKDLLKSLTGYKLALVTSSGASEIEPLLNKESVARHFAACVFGDSVQNLKPHPEPYQKAMELLGVSRALVVEDSLAGLASGRAAGCDVLEVRSAQEVPTKVGQALGLHFR